jgi:hypothetical protein
MTYQKVKLLFGWHVWQLVVSMIVRFRELYSIEVTVVRVIINQVCLVGFLNTLVSNVQEDLIWTV